MSSQKYPLPDRQYFVNAIGAICENAIADYGLEVDFSRARDLEIIDGYVGRGYALSQLPELELLYETARTEGIFFDPVYTGKCMAAMLDLLAKNMLPNARDVVFLHTGGAPAIHPYADYFSS